MAKRKTTKAKTSSRKKPQSKSNGGVIAGLLGIITILAVIVSYYYGKEQPSGSAANNRIEKRESPKETNRKEESKVEQTESEPDIVSDTKVESEKTNPKLPEYTDVDEYYFTSSFDFAWPAYEVDDLIIEHEGFTLSYDERNEQALWVAYKLEKTNLDNAKFKRKDNFREDPLVRTESASLNDYRKSGYDRGHMAPAGDFTWSEKALDDTFFMSNMSPQEPSFNRGIWKRLEEQVRKWAKKDHVIYVVTGPILKDRKKKIGDNKVTVPHSYYKAILDIQEPEIKAVGFVLENKKSGGDLLNFAMTIDDLEEITGLDFFPSLPDEMEGKLESGLNKESWK